MSSRYSLLTHFLPDRFRCRESQVQYNLNPALCQRTTVSGWTKIKARFHPGQSRRIITQNNLSGAASRGWGCFCFNTASCWRSAKFSKRRLRRERTDRTSRIPEDARRSPSLFSDFRAALRRIKDQVNCQTLSFNCDSVAQVHAIREVWLKLPTPPGRPGQTPQVRTLLNPADDLPTRRPRGRQHKRPQYNQK